MSYILDKDPTEYTGVESYISDQIKQDNLNWFPIGKAYELKDLYDESELESIEIMELNKNVIKMK